MARSKKEENTEAVVAEEQKTQVIPDYVDAVLKQHSNMEQVIVTDKGCAYVPGTPETMMCGVGTLYDNKYYNK